MMDTLPDESIETIYDEYYGEADRLKKERMRLNGRYRLWGLIGILVMGLALLGKLPPSSFWVGALLTIIIVIVASAFANSRAQKEVEQAAQSRSGFVEFCKLYSNGKYWPYQMIAGEKYDKFLSIIGRKSSV
jgi:hypothetical protein